jgi:tetratricopeptide (TPR) repeat protein
MCASAVQEGARLGHISAMKILASLATLLFATAGFGQITGGSVDREAARRFGESIATAFNERDAKLLSSLVDARGFALRTAKVQGMAPGEQEQFAAGLEKAGLSRLYESYFQSMNASNGSVKFLRVTETRPARALVRLDLGANGNDYFEFMLETREGRTRAVDWFVLSSGELVSVTIGSVAQMFTTTDAGLLGRLFGTDRVDAKSLAQLRKVGELQRAGKYAEALAQIRQLPDAMANSRVLLSAQATIAQMSKNDAEYTRVLATLAEKYSDDPATAFKLIDHYFTIKDRPRMLASLDTMEKRVGADGVTRNLRAAAYFATEDYANTLKHADEAIRLEPELMNGHDTRASALVGLARYADAIAQYQSLEKQFGLAFARDVFVSDPFFAGFVKSAAFRAWLPK